MKKLIILLILTVLFAVLRNLCFGSGSGGGGGSSTRDIGTESQRGPSLFDQGVAATNAKNFQIAVQLFNQALKQDPKNPDILNMLAHSQRQVGRIDESIANYKKALELRPFFPEAREYLGEAYLQAALLEVETLRDYGDKGKEQLEDLSKAFKATEKLVNPVVSKDSGKN